MAAFLPQLTSTPPVPITATFISSDSNSNSSNSSVGGGGLDGFWSSAPGQCSSLLATGESEECGGQGQCMAFFSNVTSSILSVRCDCNPGWTGLGALLDYSGEDCLINESAMFALNLITALSLLLVFIRSVQRLIRFIQFTHHSIMNDQVSLTIRNKTDENLSNSDAASKKGESPVQPHEKLIYCGCLSFSPYSLIFLRSLILSEHFFACFLELSFASLGIPPFVIMACDKTRVVGLDFSITIPYTLGMCCWLSGLSLFFWRLINTSAAVMAWKRHSVVHSERRKSERITGDGNDAQTKKKGLRITHTPSPIPDVPSANDAAAVAATTATQTVISPRVMSNGFLSATQPVGAGQAIIDTQRGNTSNGPIRVNVVTSTPHSSSSSSSSDSAVSVRHHNSKPSVDLAATQRAVILNATRVLLIFTAIVTSACTFPLNLIAFYPDSARLLFSVYLMPFTILGVITSAALVYYTIRLIQTLTGGMKWLNQTQRRQREASIHRLRFFVKWQFTVVPGSCTTFGLLVFHPLIRRMVPYAVPIWWTLAAAVVLVNFHVFQAPAPVKSVSTVAVEPVQRPRTQDGGETAKHDRCRSQPNYHYRSKTPTASARIQQQEAKTSANPRFNDGRERIFHGLRPSSGDSAFTSSSALAATALTLTNDYHIPIATLPLSFVAIAAPDNTDSELPIPLPLPSTTAGAATEAEVFDPLPPRPVTHWPSRSGGRLPPLQPSFNSTLTTPQLPQSFAWIDSTDRPLALA